MGKQNKSLIMRNRQKLGGVNWILHNFALDLRTSRHILMAVLWPSLEFGWVVWKTSKHQAKALESIQLRVSKFILRCSVTIWDEPVLADLHLQAFKFSKDFHKVKWYCKIKYMNDERLVFKLLSNEWNKVKSKGCPRICWFSHVKSFAERIEYNL